ncbi:unnamed protein product [Pedinophyceae sp. YPF-701]|nr:unnamed protein product [Pedinophyceae sp. YPF-701]
MTPTAALSAPQLLKSPFISSAAAAAALQAVCLSASESSWIAPSWIGSSFRAAARDASASPASAPGLFKDPIETLFPHGLSFVHNTVTAVQLAQPTVVLRYKGRHIASPTACKRVLKPSKLLIRALMALLMATRPTFQQLQHDLNEYEAGATDEAPDAAEAFARDASHILRTLVGKMVYHTSGEFAIALLEQYVIENLPARWAWKLTKDVSASLLRKQARLAAASMTFWQRRFQLASAMLSTGAYNNVIAAVALEGFGGAFDVVHCLAWYAAGKPGTREGDLMADGTQGARRDVRWCAGSLAQRMCSMAGRVAGAGLVCAAGAFIVSSRAGVFVVAGDLLGAAVIGPGIARVCLPAMLR